MRILITGHKGLVGRNVVSALSSDHEVFTLEMSHYFSDWVQRDMPEQLNQKPEVIVHIGGIMSPQTQDPNIYLWNSSAVHLLCEGIARHPDLKGGYLIFFSSRVAPWAKTVAYKDPCNPYALSKMLAEDYIFNTLNEESSTCIRSHPYCILRPQNIWGDERGLPAGRSNSVPFQLASHTLKYLLRNLSRDFVHVSDVVSLVLECIKSRCTGAYDVGTGVCVSSAELSEAITWKDYTIREPEAGRFLVPEGVAADPQKFVQGWTPALNVIDEMTRLEKEIHLES